MEKKDFSAVERGSRRTGRQPGQDQRNQSCSSTRCARGHRRPHQAPSGTRREGFTPDLIREAGLLSAGEDGGIRGEMFRRPPLPRCRPRGQAGGPARRRTCPADAHGRAHAACRRAPRRRGCGTRCSAAMAPTRTRRKRWRAPAFGTPYDRLAAPPRHGCDTRAAGLSRPAGRRLRPDRRPREGVGIPTCPARPIFCGHPPPCDRRRPRPRSPGPAGAQRPRRARSAAVHLAVITINHPDLLHDVEEAWCRVALGGWLAELREAILHLPGSLGAQGTMDHLISIGLGSQVARAFRLAAQHGRFGAAARPDAMPSVAEAGWWRWVARRIR